MKKISLSLVFGLVMLAAMSSCFHSHDISISVSDDEEEYEMEADYSRSQAHAVRVYLNDHLLNGEIKLKRNEQVDREITLDDKTNFIAATIEKTADFIFRNE